MRKYSYLFFLAAIVLFSNCGNGQTSNFQLAAVDFAEKIKELPSAPVIDVRTPGEFSKGHLQGALNIDWNGNDFQNHISNLDKSKPVFVYCLSGGRSSSAARAMRSDGFKFVYELNGGIISWRAAQLPEAVGGTAVVGMSMQQFNERINSGNTVLVDFYADWCAPCKKMKPYIDEISNNMSDNVLVIRINADENASLCKDLKIDALPVLQLYQNNNLTWTHSGFISKEDLLNQLPK